MHSSLNKCIMRCLTVLLSVYKKYPSPVVVPPASPSHETIGLVTEELIKELSFYPDSLSGLKASEELCPLQDKDGSPLKDWDKGFGYKTPHLTDVLGTLGLSKCLFYAGWKGRLFLLHKSG